MITLPIKQLRTRLPRLTDDGKQFYGDELKGYIHHIVPVTAISWHDKKVDHVVIQLERDDTVSTLFPHYFASDIVVEEIQ